MHYLDDYLILGPPDSSECQRSLKRMLNCCKRLGIPIAQHKTEGPWTVLVFLGIELNTRDSILRLPEEKLQRLQRDQQMVLHKEWPAIVDRPASTCMLYCSTRENLFEEMIDLYKRLHHSIRLNEGFRSHFYWWSYFLPRWNGVSMMKSVVHGPCYETITSDASGS